MSFRKNARRNMQQRVLASSLAGLSTALDVAVLICSFWKIAWRNMQQRALASSLTGLSMALGVAVLIAVIVIHSVAVRQFEQDAQGYHLIVGEEGSSLQLVLSSVYLLGKTLYPIPYSYYQEFEDGRFADYTNVAVPLCLGDSYEAPGGELFRVVGTTPALFEKIQYGTYSDGSPKHYEFQPGGRNFKTENFFEAVLGSVVAAQSGLKVGEEVHPTHGIGGTDRHVDAFEVVGILEPTGTAYDRAVFVNIEGFYLLDGHASAPIEDATADDTPPAADQLPTATAAEIDVAQSDAAEADSAEDSGIEALQHETHEHEQESVHRPLPISQRRVTSILVLCSSPIGPMMLDGMINKDPNSIAQAVAPAREVTQLLDGIVGPIRVVLLVLTVLIVVVAGISILVSIYNSMSERSHDIAVMRALGASRGAVMTIILFESILLAVGGGLAGMLLGHGMIALASPYVVARTGVVLGLFQFDWWELVLVPALILLAVIVGFLPALAAYRTDVAKSLSRAR